MQGRCLCGEVSFEISSPSLRYYRCYCSLCRRQTGTGFNTATIVAAQRFRWLGGEEGVGSWTKSSGFRADFCRQCGSPVPNQLRNTSFVWVPIGLLDDAHTAIELVADICLDSRAVWERVPAPAQQFAECPELGILLDALI
ncbi:GFA family protein [Thiocapsa sp.]|uniref:GFA family protein n=1 Tax=Thiocapsa sp. TaxID=2024551 RepID=UPI003593F4CE